MTLLREVDYEHANERGNGPKERMEGGDLTDDIYINDPNNPFKKKPKQENKLELELVYKKPEPSL